MSYATCRVSSGDGSRTHNTNILGAQIPSIKKNVAFAYDYTSSEHFKSSLDYLLPKTKPIAVIPGCLGNHLSGFLFSSIFHLWLVESADREPTDREATVNSRFLTRDQRPPQSSPPLPSHRSLWPMHPSRTGPPLCHSSPSWLSPGWSPSLARPSPRLAPSHCPLLRSHTSSWKPFLTTCLRQLPPASPVSSPPWHISGSTTVCVRLFTATLISLGGVRLSRAFCLLLCSSGA